jgi:hypothetical protein
MKRTVLSLIIFGPIILLIVFILLVLTGVLALKPTV